ncbi:hypothetical protein ACWDT5_00380 [Rhodococcus aetherivorans]
MSIEAITCALERAAIPSPTPPGMPSAPALTAVLISLANHASRHGEGTHPSVRTLAGYTRMSERQVRHCLAALVPVGLISRGDQQRVAVTVAREDRRPTCHHLTMRWHDASSPRSRERGDQHAPDGVPAERLRGDTPVTRTRRPRT